MKVEHALIVPHNQHSAMHIQYIRFIFYLHLRTCLLILEREEEWKRERDRNIDIREKHR